MYSPTYIWVLHIRTYICMCVHTNVCTYMQYLIMCICTYVCKYKSTLCSLRKSSAVTRSLGTLSSTSTVSVLSTCSVIILMLFSNELSSFPQDSRCSSSADLSFSSSQTDVMSVIVSSISVEN